MATAYDLIVRSMQLAKIIASGETPTADEANDALDVLNDVLENWSTEPLALWGTLNFSGTTTPNQDQYTIGPTGDWVTTRPASITAAYITYNNASIPLDIIDQVDWGLIVVKSTPSPIPQRLAYINDYPDGIIKLWPVPTEAIPISLNFHRLLTTITDLQTEIAYPPGAKLALRYALAMQLATEYGVPIDPALIAQAREYKADYKRSNRSVLRARVDPALTGTTGWFNWRTGQ